jgi:hypothetical protein
VLCKSYQKPEKKCNSRLDSGWVAWIVEMFEENGIVTNFGDSAF